LSSGFSWEDSSLANPSICASAGRLFRGETAEIKQTFQAKFVWALFIVSFQVLISILRLGVTGSPLNLESGQNVDGLVPETTRKTRERMCPGELP
jgi:hypothetical protein